MTSLGSALGFMGRWSGLTRGLRNEQKSTVWHQASICSISPTIFQKEMALGLFLLCYSRQIYWCRRIMESLRMEKNIKFTKSNYQPTKPHLSVLYHHISWTPLGMVTPWGIPGWEGGKLSPEWLQTRSSLSSMGKANIKLLLTTTGRKTICPLFIFRLRADQIGTLLRL